MFHSSLSSAFPAKSYESFHEHFALWHKLLVRVIKEAEIIDVDGMQCYLTTSKDPFDNPLLMDQECSDEQDWSARVDKILKIFQNRKQSFTWPVEEGFYSGLCKTLSSQGFQSKLSWGGAIGSLKDRNFIVNLPEGYYIEKIDVSDEKAMQAFMAHISKAFDLARDCIEQRSHKEPEYNHWVVKKEQDGEIVSTISSLIKDHTVSIWNASTTEEYRKKGLCKNLISQALCHATRHQNCDSYIAFLSPDKLVAGVLKSLGANILDSSISFFYSPDLSN